MEYSIYIVIFVLSLLISLLFIPIFKKPLQVLLVACLLTLFFFINYSQVSNYDWKSNLEVNNIESILREMDQYLLNNSEDVEALKLAGSAYLRMELYDKAFNYFRNAYQLTPKGDFIILLGLVESGLMSQSSNFPEDIEVLINQALSIEPFNPQALWYGGLIAMSKGETKVAIDRFSQLSDNKDISIQMQESINTQLQQLKLMERAFDE
jgi:cytochrome c-type biogenesis protein CcmH/NrfG|tara:strand:+ start:1546 stop:2172 length:627 start_codon:yes stop_codon:yes gene_type:complete